MPVPAEHAARREQLAKALYEADRRQLIKRLDALSYDSKQFSAFFLGLRNESDRALAIVSFSFLDEQLRDLMIRGMDFECTTEQDLFGSLGPLATASARLKLAASLRWIRSMTYRNADLLRKIRNEFAHKPFVTSFDDPRIVGYLSSMDAFEKDFSRDFPYLPSPEVLSRRHIFHIRSAVFTANMVVEVLSAPIALSMGLHPAAGLSSQDPPPKTLAEVFLAASDVMLGVLEDSIPRQSESGT